MATSKRSKSKRSKRSKSKTSKRSESKASKRSRRSGSKNRTRRSRSRAKQRTIKGRENYKLYQDPDSDELEADRWYPVQTTDHSATEVLRKCEQIQMIGLEKDGVLLDRIASRDSLGNTRRKRIHPQFWTPEEREQFVQTYAQEYLNNLVLEDVD